MISHKLYSDMTETDKEGIDLGLGVRQMPLFIDASRFGIGFDIEEVCSALEQRGFLHITRVHASRVDKGIRTSVYYNDHATVVYGDDGKVVSVSEGF
jgi:hypothetical protein